ncbi:MAG: type II toxin-antitoxin system HicA family toxin [Verrucomicrobiota bacterium]
MKRRELIRHLEAHGCPLKRDDGPHSVYWNPTTGRTESVPRHTEIAKFTARKICRCLGVPAPRD